MRKDDHVTRTAVDEECVVILNGVKMKRDEHGNYHEIKNHSEQVSLFPALVLLVSICSLFVIAALLVSQSTSNSTTIKGDTGSSINERVASGFPTEPYEVKTDESKNEDSDILYRVTVSYTDTSGATLCPSFTTLLKSGDSFSITSPAICGYTPNIAVVTGFVNDNDVMYCVYYEKNTEEGL